MGASLRGDRRRPVESIHPRYLYCPLSIELKLKIPFIASSDDFCHARNSSFGCLHPAMHLPPKLLMGTSRISWVPASVSSRGLVNRKVNMSRQSRQSRKVGMKARNLGLARLFRFPSSSVHHHLHRATSASLRCQCCNGHDSFPNHGYPKQTTTLHAQSFKGQRPKQFTWSPLRSICRQSIGLVRRPRSTSSSRLFQQPSITWPD